MAGAGDQKSEVVLTKPILTLLNGTGYVFNADDYMQLRRQHRILGAPVGTSGVRGWSPHENVLPVELTTHETRLLLEEDIALLVSKKSALLRVPHVEEAAEYKETFERRLTEQAESLKAVKLSETAQNMPRILTGKRKKAEKSGASLKEFDLSPADVLKEAAERFVFERRHALLEIPCAHPAAHSASLVLPPTPGDPLKYRVFRELWRRGYFVTPGDIFGGDFLIYPGDPLLYHSSHIVVVLAEATVGALQLVAKVRLGVSVKKETVFAFLNGAPEDAATKVEFLSLKWLRSLHAAGESPAEMKKAKLEGEEIKEKINENSRTDLKGF